MRKVLPPAAATVLLWTGTGCLDVGQVAELQGVADRAAVVLPQVSDDFLRSCQRRAKLGARLPAEDLPAGFAGSTPDCAPYALLSERLAVDQGVLLTYLQALAKLAADQNVTSGKAMDAGVATIAGFSNGPEANPELAGDAERAGSAALTLAGKLAAIATRHARERRLRELILGANASVQTLTAALATVGGVDYGTVLNAEGGFLAAYYQTPLASRGADPLLVILVQRQADRDDEALARRRAAGATYAAIMREIGATHAQLADAAAGGTGLSEALRAIGPDLDDLRGLVAKLQAEVA